DFGKLAVTMLDMSYQESKSQALDLLTTQLPDFKNYSAVDLAVIGRNKFFIAHPCCQKYAYNLWYGSIRIQKRKIGFIEIPEVIKIFLCLILILPTYYWIDIVRIYRPQTVAKPKVQVHSSYYGLKNTSLGARWKREALLIVKLYYIWTAPITQFWISQIFILSFLILFAYALSQPYCGDPFVHKVLMAWLIVLFVDNVYSLLAKKFHCGEFPIKQNVRTMCMIIYTSCIVVMFRVLHFTTLSFTTVKFLLSLSLIYFFYYAMTQFYPVSQTLGPMLVNITVMMRRDLINWLKMWFLTLVSGSVAIHAVLYPAETLDLQVAFKTLLRGVLALFMTEVDDLDGDACSCLYNYTTEFGCKDTEIPQIVKDSINTCPHTSAGGYFIVLAYIFQTKLVYNTLIFAICSVTMGRTYVKVMEIWKYQFFMLVQEFMRRPPVPIPFVVLVYPAVIIKAILIYIYHCFLTYCPFCRPREKKNKDRYISSLNDRLVEVMNSQISMFLMMENMQNALESACSGVSSLVESQHTHCRRSPYPATSIRRFAVFDKYLPWEENYPEYDPPIYSRPIEDYDEDIRIYVDPDLIEVMAKREVQDIDTEVKSGTEKVLEFEPKYNAVTEDKAVTGEIFTADRVSWIIKDDQPVQYSVDANDAPRNPMGRTGLRGRGNLWRYGPNHMMFAVISRWKSTYNTDGVLQGPLLVGNKKMLEIMVVNNPMIKEDSLPGGFVSGRTSNYSVMCEVFMRDILGEKDVPGSLTLDQDDMILFFRQFVSSEFILSGILGRNVAASTSFSSKLLYRGYMDDPNNTDNAWVEAEVWSFHYHSKDKFDKKIGQREKYWRDVSPWLQITGCHLPFVKEVQDMYNE
ncbi:unnamed protein product, partial [Candidula unifasciata]